ncbi:hypothetical protein BSKO_10166 [Bryopsis sp. KO-2023]|nr:hypothetical protein BSKO_10166 [Bryopsis sp. KO-2023]
MGCSEKGVVVDERSLRFQNRALGILMERFLDVSPYTRARTFGVWTMLVQSKVIPIDHYVPLAEAGYRHLSDKTPAVQKAAITLLNSKPNTFRPRSRVPPQFCF